VRRIVDYAKDGVRRGADPYIGKLNNSRVRAALKATLDGFLSGMVLDEMLQAYKLDVSATRAQEINGICLVTLNLQPTFSIDFVKVIMTLE
jgi:tail sheath protein